ncbi:hypothetical protein F7725_004792 [Dissostichus mawsoni]|uniref:Uncharacterized protein n=1 Tax=Dissostichus mawsoni TaxID=36200 RepID=A0A7J5XMG0_DISMA|nr:hypothetical protein F7725_004792 [Dissostichus mawsoni]
MDGWKSDQGMEGCRPGWDCKENKFRITSYKHKTGICFAFHLWTSAVVVDLFFFIYTVICWHSFEDEDIFLFSC